MVNVSEAPHRMDIPAAGRYRINPARSSVTFRTRHMFGLGTVSGTMLVTSGAITLDPAVPRASVTAAISASSFSTSNKKRDDDVRSKKFLNVDAHPEFVFHTGRLIEAQNRWFVTGELTVRGVTKPVTLTVQSVENAGQGFVALATTRIDRYAFGVTAAKGMAARHLYIALTAAADPA
jgi:polyisoprenoid-binding protein YceI